MFMVGFFPLCVLSCLVLKIFATQCREGKRRMRHQVKWSPLKGKVYRRKSPTESLLVLLFSNEKKISFQGKPVQLF